MFTIFGATGNTGSVIANGLLARGKKVRVVVRDANKAALLRAKCAEVFVGDVTQPATIKEALAGAEGAYFLIPPDATSNEFLARGERIMAAYIAALSAHPVQHVVQLSSVAAHQDSGTGPIRSVHHAELALRGVAGTAFTFLRAASVMENALMNTYAMKTDGIYPVFGGGENSPFPQVATKDIGRTAIDVLLDPPSATQVIELSGPREYSPKDVASEASRILGRPIRTVVLPLDSLVPTLMKFGLSRNFAELYLEMTIGLVSGQVRFEGTHRSIRGSTPLADVLSALRGS